jgi:hypothetical protein
MLDKARQSGTALTVVLPMLLVVSLLILCLFLLVCGYLVHANAFNSDSLYSVAQCDDLLHGREVTEWHLPGAPYLFPDLLLLLPCQLLAPTLPIAYLAYCILLHLILCAILAWLGRLSELRWRTAIVAAGCGSIFLVAAHLSRPLAARDALLVHPASHVAGLVVGLFLVALTVHSLTRGLSWTVAAVYLLIGGFGSFSDRIVVPQLLAPLALALILLAARRVIALKEAGMQLALLAGSYLLSGGIRILFTRLGFHLLELETSPGPLHLSDLFSMLSRLSSEVANDYLLCILFPLHLIVALAVIWLWSRRNVGTDENVGLNRPTVLLAALTLVLSPPCILGALFVLGMSHHPAVNRYVLSGWFLPPLLLPLLMHWLTGRTARASVIVLQTGILFFALQRAWILLPDVDRERFEQPYPPLAEALDRLARERGPLNGLGSYWLARSTTLFTREKVTVNALSVTGEPWFHASNPARFLPDDDLRIPRYQFVVMRHNDLLGLSPVVLALHFGMPSERIAAGVDEVWLYNSLCPPAFDRFLRSRLADRLHKQWSFTGPIEPACLAQPKRSITPADAPGTVALEAGQPCEIRFAQPTTGEVLDVGASWDARLEVMFFHGEEQLGSLSVPNVPWTGAYFDPGLQSRLLSLPAILREQGWDRLLIRARPNCKDVRLGHVLVFAQSSPGLDAEERPVSHVTRVRLEGEEMLPVNNPPPSDDATASGGRVRRSVNPFCCSTPRLFLRPGRYQLDIAMKVDNNGGNDELVHLYVGCLSPWAKLAYRVLRGSDFSAAGRWIVQQVAFEIPEDVEDVQISIVGTGKTPISVDYLDLIAEPQGSPGEKK